MTEHPTQLELDGYGRRVLAPDVFLSVHRHVSACPRCAAECNSPEYMARDLAHLREAFVSAPEETPYHLSTAEAEGYRRGVLNEIDLEIVESHLETCATCLDQVQVRRPSAPRRWINLPIVGRWQPVQVAAAMLLVAVLVLLAIWFARSRPPQPNQQIAWPAATPSPASAPSVQSSPTPVSPDEFVVVLNDGGRNVTLDKQGTLAGLDRLPANTQIRVNAALQRGRLDQSPALAQLASQRSTLLGSSSDGLPFRLTGPLGQVVRSQRPALRWQALPGAQSYKVIVTDAELNEVAASPALNTTMWQVTKPLPPGGIYSWQVTALKDGAAIISPVLPAPQAKFKVLDSSAARMIEQAERAYRDSHLTLGVLYAEAGLLDEAEQEFRALVRDNPRADVAQKLLRSVQAMRSAN